MSKTLPNSCELRDIWGDIVYRIARLITPKRTSQIRISRAEYESLRATIDVANNKAELAGIQRGLAELNAGQSLSFEEVFGEPLNGQECQRGQAIPHRS